MSHLSLEVISDLINRWKKKVLIVLKPIKSQRNSLTNVTDAGNILMTSIYWSTEKPQHSMSERYRKHGGKLPAHSTQTSSKLFAELVVCRLLLQGLKMESLDIVYKQAQQEVRFSGYWWVCDALILPFFINLYKLQVVDY